MLSLSGKQILNHKVRFGVQIPHSNGSDYVSISLQGHLSSSTPSSSWVLLLCVYLQENFVFFKCSFLVVFFSIFMYVPLKKILIFFLKKLFSNVCFFKHVFLRYNHYILYLHVFFRYLHLRSTCWEFSPMFTRIYPCLLNFLIDSDFMKNSSGLWVWLPSLWKFRRMKSGRICWGLPILPDWVCISWNR